MTARGQDLMDITNDSKLTSMAMSHKPEQDGAGGASEIQELLDWNNLVYTMPVTNSVVSARNMKSYRSDQAEYKLGDTIEFRVQTGSQYVDWKNSYIKLTTTVTMPLDEKAGLSPAGWGTGSAFNMIKDVVVSSRSGAELMRIEDFNLYRYLKDVWTKPPDWFNGAGSAIGYGSDKTGVVAGTTTTAGTSLKADWILPMSMFEGVFAADQLCPSYLAAGMRIELRTVSGSAPNKILLSDGAERKIADFSIKAELFCDTYLLNDAAMIELKKVSAQNGLEYVYTGIHRQRDTVGEKTVAVDKTITKAVSRALTAYAIRKPPFVDVRTVDSFEAIADCQPVKYQWRLGSQYYPHQPIEGLHEAFANALHVTDTFWKPQNVKITDFPKISITPASFERSNLLRYSGAPINNSRVLSFDGEYAGPGGAALADGNGATEFTMYLEYVTVAKVFLNNVVVTM